MTSESSDQEPTLWDERDWDELLDDVADRSIIPIVGSELLTIEFEGGTFPLYRVLAEKLARRLRLPAKSLSDRRTLNDVVCDYLSADRNRNTTDRVYGRLCEVFVELALPPPPTLVKLAEIRHLQLFLTTTPDPLLQSAINSVRFGGVDGTATLSFSPREADDLPRQYGNLDSPTVYHLLGRLSKIPDQFVVSDEDLLEFFYRLQGAANRLPNLFDALGENHLLFLGGAFSDWLARLFLRTAKRLRLSEKKSYDLLTADRLRIDCRAMRTWFFSCERLPAKHGSRFAIRSFLSTSYTVDGLHVMARCPQGILLLTFLRPPECRMMRSLSVMPVRTSKPCAGLRLR